MIAQIGEGGFGKVYQAIDSTREGPVALKLFELESDDGRRSVDEIWENAISRFGDDAPTQDEVIRLLSQLHSAEVLQTEITPDLAELMLRARRGGSKTLKQNFVNVTSFQ